MTAANPGTPESNLTFLSNNNRTPRGSCACSLGVGHEPTHTQERDANAGNDLTMLRHSKTRRIGKSGNPARTCGLRSRVGKSMTKMVHRKNRMEIGPGPWTPFFTENNASCILLNTATPVVYLISGENAARIWLSLQIPPYDFLRWKFRILQELIKTPYLAQNSFLFIGYDVHFKPTFEIFQETTNSIIHKHQKQSHFFRTDEHGIL